LKNGSLTIIATVIQNTFLLRINMKYLLLLAPLTLAACSSFEPPNVSLETDKQAFHMNRQQVILGITECEEAGTRPVVITAKRKINGIMSDVPVEVTCNPRYKLFH
jgi:uncharacterized protein YcfL